MCTVYGRPRGQIKDEILLSSPPDQSWLITTDPANAFDENNQHFVFLSSLFLLNKSHWTVIYVIMGSLKPKLLMKWKLQHKYIRPLVMNQLLSLNNYRDALVTDSNLDTSDIYSPEFKTCKPLWNRLTSFLFVYDDVWGCSHTRTPFRLVQFLIIARGFRDFSLHQRLNSI